LLSSGSRAQGRLGARRNSFSRQRARLGRRSPSSHTLKLYQRNCLSVRSEALLLQTHRENLSKKYLRTSLRDKPPRQQAFQAQLSPLCFLPKEELNNRFSLV